MALRSTPSCASLLQQVRASLKAVPEPAAAHSLLALALLARLQVLAAGSAMKQDGVETLLVAASVRAAQLPVVVVAPARCRWLQQAASLAKVALPWQPSPAA